MSTGVNSNIKVTRITFETLTVTSDMVPEDDGMAIRIKEIQLPSNAADLCGNIFENSTITVNDAPRQQEWLDTVAPVITSFDSDGGDIVICERRERHRFLCAGPDNGCNVRLLRDRRQQ